MWKWFLEPFDFLHRNVSAYISRKKNIFLSIPIVPPNPTRVETFTQHLTRRFVEWLGSNINIIQYHFNIKCGIALCNQFFYGQISPCSVFSICDTALWGLPYMNGSWFLWTCAYLKIQTSVWTNQVRSSCPLSLADAVCWLLCSETGGAQGCWNQHLRAGDVRKVPRWEKCQQRIVLLNSSINYCTFNENLTLMKQEHITRKQIKNF